MKPILIVCMLCLIAFTPSADAGWIFRGGGCAGGGCGSATVESPILHNAPDTPSVCTNCPGAAVVKGIAKATVAVAKAPVEAVENSRGRRQARGGWYLGKHLCR